MAPVRALMIALVALIAGVSGAAADPVVSPGPEAVAVTLYRAPDRPPDARMTLGWLQGYALVTERRTVMVPQGRATIRFEGVAGGILPESAIVSGLPQGVREKNLDADLLSPASLYAHGFGRPVTLRRTRDGVSTEERAILRSGPAGPAILETRAGFEVANCGPSTDRLVYDSVPAGLSAKPTLSVETDSPHGGRVTLTLSYLAWGFDWQASYVANMSPDGRTADLMAWVTLASSDPTSFAAADTNVVAGKVNREGRRYDSGWSRGGELVFQCYLSALRRFDMPPPAPPAARAMEVMMPAPIADIVVTAARVAKQEDLGDLKLYRLPEPTTVAAMAQKQVAMLNQPRVPVQIVYLADVFGDRVDSPMIALRARNRHEQGLGVPLPAGPIAVFQPFQGRPVLVGEAAIDDKAIGEDIEAKIAPATQVTAELTRERHGDAASDQLLTVRNANPFPVRFEARFLPGDGVRIDRPSAKLGRKDGLPLWQVELPANGSVTLRYRLKSG